MIEIPMIILYTTKQPLHQKFLLVQKWQKKTSKSTTTCVLFQIFQSLCRIIELSSTLFFWIYNCNRKYWNFWIILAWNIFLLEMLVKLRFPCLEVFFKPLNIKRNPILRPLWLSFKWVLWFFLWTSLSFFCRSIVLDQYNLWEKPHSIVFVLIFLFNSFGMLCGSLGLVSHIWRNSSVNFLLYLN